MTKNKEINQQEAWEQYQELLKSIRLHAVTFLQIGYNLKKIKDKKYYKFLGDGGYDTFMDFINNPEIGLSQSSCFLYMGVYEFYIEKLELSEIEVSAIPLTRLMRAKAGLKKLPVEEAREKILDYGAMTNRDYWYEAQQDGIEPEKPFLYLDKESGKYILEFNPDQMLKIVNKVTKESIYEYKEISAD